MPSPSPAQGTLICELLSGVKITKSSQRKHRLISTLNFKDVMNLTETNVVKRH